MPRLVTETLYFWVVRSGFLLIKVQTDLDDSVVLEDHCDYLVKILTVLLQQNMKSVEQDFTIDLRNFNNFQLNDCNERDENDLLDLGIQVRDAMVWCSLSFIIPQGHGAVHNRQPYHHENIGVFC